MVEIKQTETYQKWERKLKDHKAKAAIAARIFRLANGLSGMFLLLGTVLVNLEFTMGLAIESISNSVERK
jgi:putative addiction module killer protein